MSKAIVLGGGGTIGVAWQTGVVAGLAGAGIDASSADSLIGTSAGAVVGVRIALGFDMVQELERFQRPPEGTENRAQDRDGARSSEELTRAFLEIVAKAAASGRDAQEGRAGIGRLATDADTAREEVYLTRFAPLAGVEWPSVFSCTAVDVATGAFVVWDAASGVDLAAAIGASCAIPLRSPPVTVQGRRYMDGSMRSFSNADVAKGHDQILVLAPMGHSEGPGQATTLEVDALAESGAEVALITPDETAASMIGLDIMNPALEYDAAQAGFRQGRDGADGLRGLWGPASGSRINAG